MACGCQPPQSIFVVYFIDIFWPKLVPCLVLALPTIPPWVLLVFSLVIIIFGNTRYHKYCLSWLIWNVELFVIIDWTLKVRLAYDFDGTGCKLYSLATMDVMKFCLHPSQRSSQLGRLNVLTYRGDIQTWQFFSVVVTSLQRMVFSSTWRRGMTLDVVGCRVFGGKCRGCHWLVRTSLHSRVYLKVLDPSSRWYRSGTILMCRPGQIIKMLFSSLMLKCCRHRAW